MTDTTATTTRRTALKTIAGSAALLVGGAGLAGAQSDDAPVDTDGDGAADPAVTTSRLLDAVEDWRNDEIETGTLLDVLHCWREKYSLRECVEAWRNDEIESGTLLYIRDLIREEEADAAADDD
jgi:hypothetical protein